MPYVGHSIVLVVLSAVVWLPGVPLVDAEEPPAESKPADSANGTLPPDADDDAAADNTHADDEGAAEPYNILTAERLTGDWGGLRTELEEWGVTLDLSLTTVYQHNVHGGEKTRHGHRVTGSYDLELTLSPPLPLLPEGGTIYLLANGGWDQGLTGRGITGDLFGTNYDAVDDRSIDVVNLWYEQSSLDDRVRFRLGKINLTFDFDTNAYANDVSSQFLNSALNNNPQIIFPGFALGHVGAQVVVTPVDWFYFAAGVADGQADYRETGLNTAFHDEDYFFSMFEFGLTPTWKTARGELPGGYRFGLWYDPQPKEVFFDDLDGRRTTVPYRRDDVGFYLSFDQMVFKEVADDPADTQGLGLFCRYGYAHGDVNYIEHFWSVGAQYQGLLPSRDEDVLGFGAAQGILSDEVRLWGERPHRETVLELYYRIQVAPWLSISPDVQMILDPGGTRSGQDALVVGVRVQAMF